MNGSQTIQPFLIFFAVTIGGNGAAATFVHWWGVNAYLKLFHREVLAVKLTAHVATATVSNKRIFFETVSDEAVTLCYNLISRRRLLFIVTFSACKIK